jgi:hypothetical protein
MQVRGTAVGRKELTLHCRLQIRLQLQEPQVPLLPGEPCSAVSSICNELARKAAVQPSGMNETLAHQGRPSRACHARMYIWQSSRLSMHLQNQRQLFAVRDDFSVLSARSPATTSRATTSTPARSAAQTTSSTTQSAASASVSLSTLQSV